MFRRHYVALALPDYALSVVVAEFPAVFNIKFPIFDVAAAVDPCDARVGPKARVAHIPFLLELFSHDGRGDGDDF
jgi:hypothetical protein